MKFPRLVEMINKQVNFERVEKIVKYSSNESLRDKSKSWERKTSKESFGLSDLTPEIQKEIS